MQHTFLTYRINAFSESCFGGNPATVCLLDTWLDNDILLKIAQENGTRETSYLKKEKNGYHIRWFSPAQEIALCGHGTLAACHALRNITQDTTWKLQSKSGLLTVTYEAGDYKLAFPSKPMPSVLSKQDAWKNLVLKSCILYEGDVTIAVFNNQQDVEAFVSCALLKNLKTRSLIITAPGRDCDYVLRYFTPFEKEIEDYVTGSTHCYLAPYWASHYDKVCLTSKQLSSRMGLITCHVSDKTVFIKGHAVTYFKGNISIEI